MTGFPDNPRPNGMRPASGVRSPEPGAVPSGTSVPHDLVSPIRSGDRNGGIDARESLHPHPQKHINLIIVPDQDSDSPPTREVPHAGDSTGKYRALQGPSTWQGTKVIGAGGKVATTFTMSENVVPQSGVEISDVTDADVTTAGKYTHHVSVVLTRVTPTQQQEPTREKGQELPRETTKDGVAADFLYDFKQGAGVRIDVRTTNVAPEDIERAIVDATLKIQNGKTFNDYDSTRAAEESRVLLDGLVKSDRQKAPVTVTTIVFSGQKSEDAMAGAQAFIARPERPDYPFAATLGTYSTDLDAAHASVPTDSTSWHTAEENGALTHLPVEKSHPGTPRVVDINLSPYVPEIPEGVPSIAIGVNTKSGEFYRYPHQDTHLVVAGASGWGKSNFLVEAAGSVVEANDSTEARKAAGGRGIDTSVFYWSLARDKAAPTQELADRIHVIEGHADDAVVDIQLGAVGGKNFSYGIDMMEVPVGYPVGRWMADFVDMSILGWAADHKSRNPGEDTDASERALRDRWREVLSGSATTGEAGLMWKKGWDEVLDRSRYIAGRPASLNMEETVEAMMQVVLAQTITGDRNAQHLGEHSRDYGDWLKRNAFSTSTGQTGRLLHARDQKLDMRGMLAQGKHGSFSFQDVDQPAFVAAAYMTRLQQEQWVLNSERAAQGRPVIRQDWSIDEAGVMLNSTVGEQFLQNLTARARSVSMGRDAGGTTVKLGVQNLEDLPVGIGINARALVVGATPAGEIQQRLKEQFGLSRAGQDRLGNLLPGKAFVRSPFQVDDRVSEITIPDIGRLESGTGNVNKADAFLTVGPAFEGPVRNEVSKPALDFFRDPRGQKFQFHVDIAVGVFVDGNGHTEAGKGLKASLSSYLDERMREVNLPADQKAQLRTDIQNHIVRLAIARAVSAATTELLKSGINPDIVARRMAEWLPARTSEKNPDEKYVFGAGESFFDTVTHNGRFNAIRKTAESLVEPLVITPEYGIDLDPAVAENAITQRRMVDRIVRGEIKARYGNLRQALTEKQRREGQDADRLPDYKREWQRTVGDIPGITVADSAGQLGTTVGEQLRYLQAWEERIIEKPSMLGNGKWEWLATQRRKIVDHIAAAPVFDPEERRQWETLYSEVMPGISFAASSIPELLHNIDEYEKAMIEGLKGQGLYRPTDLAEIIAPGTAGKTVLESALVADAAMTYPTWSGHPVFDASVHTPQAYIKGNQEKELAKIVDKLIDDSQTHPYARTRIAEVINRLLVEMIQIRDRKGAQ